MFRIRQVANTHAPVNRAAIAQAQEIMRQQFPLVSPAVVAKIPEQLDNPLKHRFRSFLLVADDWRGTVKGFALCQHDADLGFVYLDFLAASRPSAGRGIGGALYERVREIARSLGTVGVFFECLPDEPALSRDPAVRAENALRLAFYERFGARPVAGTAYETPVTPTGDNPPYLVFDGLGRDVPLPRERARRIVRVIIERKYPDLCPPDYVRMVVDSFRDDPVRLRPARYGTKERAAPSVGSAAPRIALVVTDRSAIHHVRERGYVESPARIVSICRELDRTGLFERVEPIHFGEHHIKAVHEAAFVDYLRNMCATLEGDASVYPYVFPVRNAARPPKDLGMRAGYYCIDTFTPLNHNAYPAAARAVDCALTAAQRVLEGTRLAYALVRPPGHHAERRAFGGFCYLNAAAVAANYLSGYGTVAMLDIDYHHGNGQQTIFYRRSDVLTVSLHGHPRFAYPYFSGFEDERGEADGLGFNLNLALPERLDGAGYREALAKALRRVQRFAPQYLVVLLGLDTAKGDPTGTWSLRARDFEENGRMIGALGLPTLVVQEGGYDNRVLGVNARHFFTGLAAGPVEPARVRPAPRARVPALLADEVS